MAMITNTAETNPTAQQFQRLSSLPRGTTRVLATFALAFTSIALHASPNPGVWTPLFKGVDHAAGTNNPSASFPNLQVVRCVRVDLTDPDIRLLSTPRASGYTEDSR